MDGRVCAGCRFLENRVFFFGEGPLPPLHHGCRRVAVDLAAFSGSQLIALVLTARRNGARGEELRDEAWRRRLREEGRTHGAGRMLRRMARRAVRREQRQEGARG